MFRLLFVTALACFTPLASAQGTAATPSAPTTETSAEAVLAGKTALVEGDVRIFDKEKQLRRPKVGDPLYKGDSIVTGKDGEVHFDMEDGGYIGVRPSTKMRIANYKAEGGPDDISVIGLLEGSFRSVTGWIGKLGRRRYQINAPAATIGIRGTEHEPKVILEGSAEGDPGTYDRVYNGETFMQTPKGTVSVRPNQAGFAPVRGGVAPRVLDRIPDHFRPTRNETRFQGLHNRIQQNLDQQRQQRIKQIQQRRQQPGVQHEQRKADAQQRKEQRKQQLVQRREQAQKQQQNRKQQFERRQQAQKERQQAKKERQQAEKERQEAQKQRDQRKQQLRKRQKVQESQ